MSLDADESMMGGGGRGLDDEVERMDSARKLHTNATQPRMHPADDTTPVRLVFQDDKVDGEKEMLAFHIPRHVIANELGGAGRCAVLYDTDHTLDLAHPEGVMGIDLALALHGYLAGIVAFYEQHPIPGAARVAALVAYRQQLVATLIAPLSWTQRLRLVMAVDFYCHATNALHVHLARALDAEIDTIHGLVRRPDEWLRDAAAANCQGRGPHWLCCHAGGGSCRRNEPIDARNLNDDENTIESPVKRWHPSDTERITYEAHFRCGDFTTPMPPRTAELLPSSSSTTTDKNPCAEPLKESLKEPLQESLKRSRADQLDTDCDMQSSTVAKRSRVLEEQSLEELPKEESSSSSSSSSSLDMAHAMAEEAAAWIKHEARAMETVAAAASDSTPVIVSKPVRMYAHDMHPQDLHSMLQLAHTYHFHVCSHQPTFAHDAQGAMRLHPAYEAYWRSLPRHTWMDWQWVELLSRTLVRMGRLDACLIDLFAPDAGVSHLMRDTQLFATAYDATANIPHLYTTQPPTKCRNGWVVQQPPPPPLASSPSIPCFVPDQATFWSNLVAFVGMERALGPNSSNISTTTTTTTADLLQELLDMNAHNPEASTACAGGSIARNLASRQAQAYMGIDKHVYQSDCDFFIIGTHAAAKERLFKRILAWFRRHLGFLPLVEGATRARLQALTRSSVELKLY
jgi:hypothetical protein